jgi:hypothetical protein
MVRSARRLPLVTTMAAPEVATGRLAGWIGVGGPNAGPGGEAEWLRTCLNAQAGIGSQLYAETAPSV